MDVLGHGLPLPLNRQSLDLATGPLINFGGASAAYSLRDLNGRNPRVVRVRRASDNSERDFYEDGVNSGELVNWVNAQIVPPLDVRELVDGERTGALIPAAAAYSLRNLSTSYTGNVVDVRRSSDDTEDSFTAAEVADGTLEAWVGASLDIVTPTLNNGGFETAGTNGFDYWFESTYGSSTITRDTSEFYSGTASCRFDIDSSGSFAGIRTAVDGGVFAVGTTLTYSIRAKGTSGSKLLIGTSGNDTRNDTLNLTTEWQEYTGTVNPADTDSNIQIKRLDSANATIWIDEVTFTINGKDGFVTQWYDQSGNNNHATQGTDASQPKIVDAGSLVSGGLDFDGTQELGKSFPSGFSGKEQSYFVKFTPTSTVGYVVELEGGIGAARSLTVEPFLRFNVTTQDYSSTILSGDSLLSLVCPNTPTTIDDYNLYYQGSILTPDSLSAGVLAGVTSGAINIGSGSYVGRISEVIAYNSDQSDNRTAFEANIGETYGIDLPSGVDTGYDQVDGFVETWYDQSGNDNDAVQETAGNQPKIVDAGVLVTNDEGNPAIQGATGKSFGLSAITGLEDVSIFFVGAVPSSFQAITGWDTNLHMIRFSSSNWEFVASTTDAGNMDWNSALTSGDTALFNFTRSSGTVTGYANSVASDTTSNANSNPFGLNRIFTRSTVNYNDYGGKASELIIYPSDQSANRAAIETNINNQYDIY